MVGLLSARWGVFFVFLHYWNIVIFQVHPDFWNPRDVNVLHCGESSDGDIFRIAKSGAEGAKVNTLAMAAAKATKTQAVTKAVLTTHAEAKKAKMKKSGSRNKERLRSDIVYLHSLASKIERRTDIDEDKVQALVSREANAALTMLKEREEFWKLVDNSSSVPPPTT